MNLEQRLTDAALHVAEHVEPPVVDLDAVRSQAHARRRMTVALAVAAAIIAVGLAGIPLLAAGRDTTAPQPAVTPRSEILRTLRDSDCAAGRCLRPNNYSIPLGQSLSGERLRARMTVRGEGWEAEGWLHRVSRADAGGTVVLSVYQPHEFAGPQPCEPDGATRKVAPDATVDDVVRLLTTLPQFAVARGAARGRGLRPCHTQPAGPGEPAQLPRGRCAVQPGEHLRGRRRRTGLTSPTSTPISRSSSSSGSWSSKARPVVVEARQEGTPTGGADSEARPGTRVTRVRDPAVDQAFAGSARNGCWPSAARTRRPRRHSNPNGARQRSHQIANNPTPEIPHLGRLEGQHPGGPSSSATTASPRITIRDPPAADRRGRGAPLKRRRRASAVGHAVLMSTLGMVVRRRDDATSSAVRARPARTSSRWWVVPAGRRAPPCAAPCCGVAR